jgi:hypothetical protein
MIKTVAAFLFAMAMVVAPSASGQGNAADATDMQALRNAVRADKKAYVASMLNLTPAEAKNFWPAYDAYQRTLDMTNRDRNVTIEGVISSDRPVSDPYARQIAKDLVEADEIEVKARRKLYSRVMRALPPKKAVRYLQLESKIRAAQSYAIAETIPLIK